MRKKRTTGSSHSRRGWLQAALLLGLTVLDFSSASAKDKPKKQLAPYAVITGSVFREEGFSLPGAEVTVTSSSPQAGKKQRRPVGMVANLNRDNVARPERFQLMRKKLRSLLDSRKGAINSAIPV